MKVYHGSYTVITEIDLSKCEKNKVFRHRFYFIGIIEATYLSDKTKKQ